MKLLKGKCKNCGAENSKKPDEWALTWLKEHNNHSCFDYVNCWYCKEIVEVFLRIN